MDIDTARKISGNMKKNRCEIDIVFTCYLTPEEQTNCIFCEKKEIDPNLLPLLDEQLIKLQSDNFEYCIYFYNGLCKSKTAHKELLILSTIKTIKNLLKKVTEYIMKLYNEEK